MPGYLKILIAVLILISARRQAIAQEFKFEYLTVKDGLAQNTVSSIVKDNDGFMWFGTWNGLCRYDGYKFRVYNSIPGDSTSIANNRIHYIYKDAGGTLWITTFDSYICRYNRHTDNFTRFKPRQLAQALQDSTNRLRNVTILNNLAPVLQKYIGPFEVPPSREHIVFQAKPGNQGSINDNIVNCAYSDNKGILWLGTSKGGVNKLDLNVKPFRTFPLLIDKGTAVNTPVRAILADSAKIWLGTQNHGLFYIDRPTGMQRQFSPGPVGKNVRCIFRDSYGDTWIGSRTGLDKHIRNKNTFTTYYNGNTGLQPTDYRFYSMAEDPVDRSVWFGTTRNVYKYNRKADSLEPQQLSKFFNNSGAVCLFFDSKGNLWIGTEYVGIILLKRDSKTHLWTDTVNYISTGETRRLPDDRVYSIREDNTGQIWAGTANGLCCIDPRNNTVKVYTKQQGLSDQYVSCILPDKKGNIWISHERGLSKLTIGTGAIRNYAVNENFQAYDFMEGAGFADTATGEMFFGNMEGLVSFHPGEITDNPDLPMVAITELQVLNKPVEIGQTVNGQTVLTTPIHLAKEITLTYHDRSFSLEFAALHYSSPERNRYTYMLEGQDKEWISADASRRIATYSNLPEGKYYFKVKASNSDGVWNPTPTVLQITVLPPWWRTWWAYLIYTFLLLGAVVVVYKLTRARVRYHRQILAEQLKAEKAQELDQLKSRFFTNISHEFRTPLTLIIDPLESLLSGKLTAQKASEYYAIMHRNARRLLGLVNQLLDFRKLESGNMQLRIASQDIVAFIRNTMAAFAFRAKQKAIDFTFESKIEALEFGFDADIVDKILYNLISNAFKFTGEGGLIKVSLFPAAGEPGQVVLTVTDNGKGIPPELTERIFDAFFQVEDQEGSMLEGSGVGLSLTRELVTLHKGTITVSSVPLVETCFTVTLSSLALTREEPNHRQDSFSPANAADFAPAVMEQDAGHEPVVVLVVEDNTDIRNYLKMNLKAEYEVIEAENGSAGLEKAMERIPDLVISDIMMPGMNGLELCSKLKSDEKTSHIPVILLTARQSDEFQAEGYETGADAYIVKPFSMALLHVRVRNLIDSRKKLRMLFNKSNGFDTRLVGTNTADKAFLSRSTILIEEHMCDENFGVDWLASQLFLSRTQLYRKLKALTNQSVHEFVTTIRLNKAAGLLLEGQLSVSEIAFMVGYSDSTGFARSFQKQFGETPKKFSQQSKNTIT